MFWSTMRSTSDVGRKHQVPRFLVNLFSSAQSLSSAQSHALLWLKSLEEGYWSGSRKSTKHSGRREDSRRRLTGVKPVGDLQPWGNLLPWEIFNLEETFRLEEFFKTSVLRKMTSDTIMTHDTLTNFLAALNKPPQTQPTQCRITMDYV